MSHPALAIWQKNAKPWINTIDKQEIASRRLTNPAIVAAARALRPDSVLDLGCGEGWLLRALGEAIDDEQPPQKRTGIDGVSALVEAARQRDPAGEYHPVSFDELAGHRDLGRFELIVCNYALFQKEEVVDLLKTLQDFIVPEGALLIQTVHDEVFPSPGRWIEEKWRLMEQNYVGSYRWYYRGRAEWEADFATAGWKMDRCIETSNSAGKKLSFIFRLSAIR